MRLIYMAVIAFFLVGEASAQNKIYDSVLAKNLGADQYGMKHYVMAFLKPGTVVLKDSVQRKQLMQAHLKNIGLLPKEGKLAIAGPFLDGGNYAGVYIFNVTNVADAKALVETDPAVKAGVFSFEMHPWYGSAALMQVVPIHNTIQKSSLTD
jgi:uncharacterized protein YciI